MRAHARDRRALQRRARARHDPAAEVPDARRPRRLRVPRRALREGPAQALRQGHARAPGAAPLRAEDDPRDGLRRLLPDRLGLRRLREAERRSASARAAARPPARSSPTASRSPTSTRSATTCSSSASSTRAASRLPGHRHRLRRRRPRARHQLRRREVRPRPRRPDHHLRDDDGPRGGARRRPRARDPVRHRRPDREADPGRPEGLPRRLPEARAGAASRPTTPTRSSREIVDLAKPLEGLVRQDSIHAAGVVIADRPLTDVVPLQQKGADQEVVTQFAGGDVEALGLLKIDFLGLRNLDVIDEAVELVGGGLDIDDDPARRRARRTRCSPRADSTGVFQFESSGMREALRQVKPTEFEDLIALVALYRPGPDGLHPGLRAAQERPGAGDLHRPAARGDHRGHRTASASTRSSTCEIAKQIAGFSPAEADDLRKAIGKKIHSLMASLKDKFLEGCAANGTTPAVANQLWKDMEQSQDYSFNKSHSACYALIAYRTAWLKANHPHEYMAALISSVMNTKDRVPFYVNACHEMGIEVLPPDVNVSQCDFAVVEGKIRFGLNAVKNVGDSAARAIVAARGEGGRVRVALGLHRARRPAGREQARARVARQVRRARLDGLVAARDARGARARALARPARRRPTGCAARSRSSTAGRARSRRTRRSAARSSRRPSCSRLEKESARPLRLRAPARGDPRPAPAQDRRVARRARAPARRRDRHGRRDRLGDQAADDEEGRPDGLHAARRRPRQRRGASSSTRSTRPRASCCMTDAVLVVKARVDHKEGETKLIALEVSAFEATPERREVRLKLDARRARAGIIRELAAVVRDFPGEAPVVLELDHLRGRTGLPVRPGLPRAPGAGLLRRGQGLARRSSGGVVGLEAYACLLRLR